MHSVIASAAENSRLIWPMFNPEVESMPLRPRRNLPVSPIQFVSLELGAQ
jgi:hypothetical protein